MGTISNTFRLPADVSNALKNAAVAPYSKSYLVVEALKAYKPIKKLLSGNPTDKATVKPTAKRFTKPDYGQLVQAFWDSGQLKDYTEAEEAAKTFLNHYDGNGWKVGRNPMKDWQATVKNWLTRRKQNGSTNGHQQSNKYPAKKSLAQRSQESSDSLDTYIEALRANEANMEANDSAVSVQMDL